MPKMPAVLRSKPMAPPPGRIWRAFAGFVVDVPGYGPWAPRLDETYRSTHAGLVHVAGLGALDRFFVDSGPDDGRATSDDINRARAASMARQWENSAEAAQVPTVRPPEHVVCVSRVFAGGSSGVTVFEVGGVYNAALPLVKKNPKAFRPALAGDLDKEA